MSWEKNVYHKQINSFLKTKNIMLFKSSIELICGLLSVILFLIFEEN